MQELIEKLQNQFGLKAEQSQGIVNTVIAFIKDKVPMLGGALDSLGGSGTDTDKAQAVAGGAAEKGSLLDKISDVLPGEAGEKAEQFAKDKLGGIL